MSVNGTNGSNATLKFGTVCAGMLVAGAVGMPVAEPANAAGLEDGSPYAPENWTVVPESVLGDGVDFTQGTNTITLGAGAAPASASIRTVAAGTVSFNWVNNLDGEGGEGVPSFTVGDITENLPPRGSDSGLSFEVSQGDLISFDLGDTDSTTGAFSIDSFDAPIPTPAMLPGLIGMGVAFWRKKVSGEQNELETSEEL